MKSTEYLARSVNLAFNQNEYGRANFHYCWATSPICEGFYIGKDFNTYRCTTTVGNKRFKIGELETTDSRKYLSNELFNKNLFSMKDCL